MKPLLMEQGGPLQDDDIDEEGPKSSSNTTNASYLESIFLDNPEFYTQALKFLFCFCGLQASYLTWGYMQELIMTTKFTPTERVPSGKFPSAAFCVFSNRFLAVIVAMIAVKIRHGAVFSNNAAPLLSFTPCALSNTMSSWSQYASLKYVSFPVQTIFKSSKGELHTLFCPNKQALSYNSTLFLYSFLSTVIPVMIMGLLLKGTKYPFSQYVEATLITIGVAVFSLASKSNDKDTTTEIIGLVFLIAYVSFDSFTSQWQDKIYQTYGKANVDPYQMMLGVNTSAIIITTAGLILSGDFPIVIEFLKANPSVFQYNVITAITSASGQLCIYYTIKEFGPIVFTIIMTTRQMISICISSVIFGHAMNVYSLCGAAIVFGVLFYQIKNKYTSSTKKRKVPKSPSR